MISSIGELAAAFDDSGRPVIVVETEHAEDGSDALPSARREGKIPATRGTDGSRRPQTLVLPPTAIRVTKSKYSAFHETDLLSKVHGLEGPLVFCGVNTHACVRTSIIDAVQFGFDVVVAADCVASYDKEFERESLRYIGARLGPVYTNVEIINLLQLRRNVP